MATFNRNTITEWLCWVSDRRQMVKSLSQNSGSEGVLVDFASPVLCPFRYSLGLSERGKKSIPFSVSGLLFGGCKFAILWCVIAIVIFSLYPKPLFVPARECPLLKSVVAVSPLSAHSDTTTAVSFKIFAAGGVTTPYHSAPNSIERSFVQSYSFVEGFGLAINRAVGSFAVKLSSTIFAFMFHASPPYDIQVGSGETNLGVVGVQDGFDGRLYPRITSIPGKGQGE